MNLNELFKELKSNVDNELEGKLSFDGHTIKWEFDGFMSGIFDEDDLYTIYDNDIEILKDNIDTDLFLFTEPEIDDTFIYFYIEE